VDKPDWWREVHAPSRAYVSMTTNQPLTLTVEQAAQVLGIGRSTAYELVRSGELACIHLRRRIVVPIAHLAERLGVEREAVWDALALTAIDVRVDPSDAAPAPCAPTSTSTAAPSLF
jgi:excisionase family DNA binding protein